MIPTDGKHAKQEDNIKEIDNHDINKESTAHKERMELLHYINKCLQKDLYAKTTIIWDPVLGSGTPHAQPNGNLFDLYIKQNGIEEFIEIKYLVPSFDLFNLIDRQLSAVANYNYINHRNACYVLIICNNKLNDEFLLERNGQKYQRLLYEYAEEIDAGLMKVIMR